MQIYRLIENKYAQSLLRGEFRFVRLRVYQMREIVFEDDSIGDVEEGAASSKFGFEFTPESQGAPIRKTLEEKGLMKVSGGSRVDAKTISIRSEVDCFVSCWSVSSKPDLSGVGSRYDTCVTASDAVTLAHLLYTQGVEFETGQSVGSVFLPIRFDEVDYLDREFDIAAGVLPSGDPFVKRRKYSKQAEYRFVLFPRSPVNADAVTVKCPTATALLSSRAVTPTCVEKVFDHPERISAHWRSELDMLVESWRVLQTKLHEEDERGMAGIRHLFQSQVGSDRGAFHAVRAAATAVHAVQEASMARRREAISEFDRLHLMRLRRCLFELRKSPYNDLLDRLLAHGHTSEQLMPFVSA